MIISANTSPELSEFNTLLSLTVKELNHRAHQASNTIADLKGNKLEPYVKDIMSDLAIGTPFENSIELIGGQKFPDIIAKRFYGIEVKTTTQDHWKTTGNSVLESTRVEYVERIFMLFAKLANPIEFKCRPYEDCLSEVVVTHSPRYLIDMNLDQGNTIFDKINTPYDILRKKENPIKSIIDYYKSKLKAGEDLWWIDSETTQASNFIIRIWNNLTPNERHSVKVKAMTYFPELFSNSNEKFSRMAIWLTTREAIVCPNVRDLFTAGGKGELLVGKNVYKKTPRIFINLISHLDEIITLIYKTPTHDLSHYWGKKVSDKKKIETWVSLVSENSKSISSIKHLDIKKIILKKLQK